MIRTRSCLAKCSRSARFALKLVAARHWHEPRVDTARAFLFFWHQNTDERSNLCIRKKRIIRLGMLLETHQMKKTMQSVFAALFFTVSPLHAQQAASPPDSKAIANPAAAAARNKTSVASDAKNQASAESKREARNERREHRKTVNHRQRRKH